MQIINEAHIPFSAKFIWLMKVYLEREGEQNVGPTKLASVIKSSTGKPISRTRIYEAIESIEKAGLIDTFNTPAKPRFAVPFPGTNGHLGEDGVYRNPVQYTKESVPESGTEVYRNPVQYTKESVPESGTVSVPESGTVEKSFPYIENYSLKSVLNETLTTVETQNAEETHARLGLSGPALEEVQEYFKACHATAGIDFDPALEAEAFWNHNDALGWYSGSTPVLRWRPLANKWLMNIRTGRVSAHRLPQAQDSDEHWFRLNLSYISDFPERLQDEARRRFPDKPEQR